MVYLPSTLSLAISLLALTPVHAADCGNYKGGMKNYIAKSEPDLWKLRQQACGDGKCGNKQQCELKVGKAKLFRKDVQYNYKNCWTAMENIITQCNRNWYTTGWWQKGDEFYQITVDGVN